MKTTPSLSVNRKSENFAPTTLVPVSMLRSALFGVAAKGEDIKWKSVLSDKRLAGLEIGYSGPYLNQEHFKVWQACVYLAKQAGGLDGERVHVSSFADLLSLCGRQTRDCKQYDRVWKLMKDLTKANLEIRSSRTSVDYLGVLISEVGRKSVSSKVPSDCAGGLVVEASRNIKHSKVFFRLNPTLAEFLSNETLSNDILRLAGLGKDQLAAWLHNYYATQKVPPPLTVEELQQLCGTKLDLPRFKQRLRKALDRLMEGVRPLIVEWRVDPNDIVWVKKTPTVVDMRSPEAVKADDFKRWKERQGRAGKETGKPARHVNANRGKVVH